MTLQPINDFMTSLRRHGVQIATDGERLRLKTADGGLSQALRQELAARKTEIIAFLHAAQQSRAESTIPSVNRAGSLPLSFAQQRLWILDQMGTGIAYNVPTAIRLQGQLNVSALQQTLNAIVARHEVLRTTFATAATGEPEQVIHSGVAVPLPLIDLTQSSGEEQATKLQRLYEEEVFLPFDLTTDLMVRTKLIQLGSEVNVLLVSFHHIATDGWSIGIFTQELATLYEAFSQGHSVPLPPLNIQYADFAFWQQNRVRDGEQDGESARQLDYWLQQLAGAPPLLQLPTDRPRPAVPSYRGGVIPFQLDRQLTQELKQLSLQADVTLYMTLLAAFQLLLMRYTGQEDVVIGSPIANRTRRELEPLIGYFLNTLALRTDLSGNPTFLELLAQVRQTAQAAYSHQDLPFERLVDALQPMRALDHSPIVQVVFILQNTTQPTMTFGDLQGEVMTFDIQNVRMDLELDLREEDGQIIGKWIYSSDLFDRSTIERMSRHFTTLLAGIIAAPSTPIATLPLLTEAEQRQILVSWNETAADYPDDRCIHQLFEEQVERTPDAVAVEMAEARRRDPHAPLSTLQSLTYRELNDRANQVAHHLRTLGVGPESVVGICMERSVEMVVGLLGILKAGGAYLPLDPMYPAERLAYMLEDSESKILLTEPQLAKPLPVEDVEHLYVMDIIGQSPSQSPWLSRGNPDNQNSPDNLAYLIYTSGSTGKPKGAQGLHRNTLNRLTWMWNTMPFAADEVCCQKTPLSFVDSIWEIFGSLLRGRPLVIFPDAIVKDPQRLVQTLREKQIVRLMIVPSLLNLLLEHYPDLPAQLPRLQYWFCGGEAMSTELCHRFYQSEPTAGLFNLYGSSELAADATWYHASDADCSAHQARSGFPIGRPLANVHTYIVDKHLQPVPVGVAGELLVGGANLARGYHKRQELTAEKFIPNPFGDHPTRLFRTGDLARYQADGTIAYLGRIDHQINLRGFRIELGEIEATLTEHTAIRDAAVVVREAQSEHTDHEYLIAYLVANQTETESVSASNANNPLPDNLSYLSPSKIRSWLQEKLPDYMIPATFVWLDALPLTPSGKVDRRALPSPVNLGREKGADFVPPGTPTEVALAKFWADLLDIEGIGIHDNFFEVGGHSLIAIQLITRIQREFSVDISLHALFEAPTIAELAESIQLAQQDDGSLPFMLPQIIPDQNRRYDPFPLTDIQHAYWMGRSDVFTLGNVATHIYLEIEAEVDIARLNRAWQRLIDRHEMLRAVILPDGQQQILAETPPYHFQLLDLRDHDAVSAQVALDAIREEMSHQVLPTDRWPLFDIRATQLPSGGVRLHISLDALIVDGWSTFVLFNEWLTLYADPGVVLPKLTISFRDYVVAERALAETDAYQQAWRYWTKRLATLPPAPELPLAQDPSQLAHPRFVRRTERLDPDLWKWLKRRAHMAKLTPSGLLLAAFSKVLATWSKSSQFTLNLTLFNRLPFHPQINAIVGDFTPLMLYAVDMTTPGSFTEHALQAQQQLWADLDHRYVNGVRLLRELARQHTENNHALMPVVFTSLLALDQGVSTDAFQGEVVYSISQTPQVWLDHQVMEENGALVFHWDAVEELFPAGLLDEMFTAYCDLLERLATDETVWHDPHLSLVPSGQLTERAAVNATDAPISEEMLHTLFLKQATARADSDAVITLTRRLTYGEVRSRANQVGHWLRERGAATNTLVAVVMEKGWEQVVAVLGVHMAGAAYLPIDPNLPTERQHYLLAEGRVTLALVQHHLDEALLWPEGLERLAIDDLQPVDDLPQLDIVQQPADLAYVIYTSGSTGLPKGVVIDHRGAVNTILDINQRFHVTHADRVLALSALNFDLSVYDIFGLLAVGGAIVFPDAALRTDPAHWWNLIERHDVTVWNTVPALMQMCVEFAETQSYVPAALKVVMMSGDWIPVSLPERINSLWPQAAVYSLGGATEASIWSITYPIEAVDSTWASIPYGKPLTNQRFYVLDGQLNPRPTWVPGDLYIGGIGLALGYWQDEARTKAGFITHPHTGERLYKTGDLGRYLPDGNIEFLGREDFQVKIRGHRIELGEIESALLQHPEINEVVVSAVGEAKDKRQLVAYIVQDRPAQHDPSSNGMLQMPDAYPFDKRDERSPSGLLADPLERLEFKLGQPGIRSFNGEITGTSQPAVQLSAVAFDEARRDAWLSRQSYRTFVDETIPFDVFSDFLSCLIQMSVEKAPLPKYRYPSAGNLYPVQSYLYIKPSRIEGVAGGFYYHHPQRHCLVPLAPDDGTIMALYASVNAAIFAQAAFSLFLVADLDAIVPMYGEVARDFALLEAGYMSQLLMMEAPQHGLGLCPIGGADVPTLQRVLALGENHQFLHCLAGGQIEPVQRTQWLQSEPNVETSATAQSWQAQLRDYLQEKLPEYMVPTAFVALPSLPLTPNGKVDRKALPTPDLAMQQTKAYVAPRTETEHLLAELWAELLGLEQVGVHDDFFTLGGDSLIATQLKSRIQEVTHYDLPLRTMFENNTVSSLAEEIDAYQIIHDMDTTDVPESEFAVEAEFGDAAFDDAGSEIIDFG